MAPQLIAQERKIFKGVSPNVDFYSGFVYEMLGIPMELYTPLFAVARVMGWSAHRIEELLSANKIIRRPTRALAAPTIISRAASGIKGGHQHGRVAAASGGMVLPPRA